MTCEIQQAFERFHALNPQAYGLFDRFTKRMIANGRKATSHPGRMRRRQTRRAKVMVSVDILPYKCFLRSGRTPITGGLIGYLGGSTCNSEL